MIPPPCCCSCGSAMPKLVAAIASPRAEHVAGQASRVQADRNRLREVRIADDDGDRCPPVTVTKDHEPGRESALQGDRRFGDHGQRFDRRSPELRHRVGGHDDQRRITPAHRRTLAIAHEQGRELLREFGKLDRSGRCFAHRNDVQLAGDLRIRRQRKDGRRIVQVAERETGWSCAVEIQRPGAARGDEEVGPGGRTQQSEGGKSFLGQSVDRHQHRRAVIRRHDDRPSRPELGKTPLHSDLFGRAKQAGNSHSYSCHPTHLGRQPGAAWTEQQRARAAFIPLGDVFFSRAFPVTIPRNIMA